MADLKNQLKELVANAENQLNQVKEDLNKFVEKDNKAAGTRVRTGSMDIIKTLKEVRNTVTEIKNS